MLRASFTLVVEETVLPRRPELLAVSLNLLRIRCGVLNQSASPPNILCVINEKIRARRAVPSARSQLCPGDQSPHRPHSTFERPGAHVGKIQPILAWLKLAQDEGAISTSDGAEQRW